MSDITNIAVSAGNVVPVDTLGGQVTVKVNSGGPVYYADNAQVSSANNQGNITAGNSVTFSAPQFITGAAGVQASVTLTLFAGSSTAPGGPKDVVLGSDGLVGGPGGTGLTTSVLSDGSTRPQGSVLKYATTAAAPMVIQENEQPFSGTTDCGFYFGYNVGAGGTQLVAGEPTLFMTIESDFNDGTHHWMEWNLHHRTAAGTDYEPFNLQVERSTKQTNLLVYAGTLSFAPDGVTASPKAQFNQMPVFAQAFNAGQIQIGSSATVATIGFGSDSGTTLFRNVNDLKTNATFEAVGNINSDSWINANYGTANNITLGYNGGAKPAITFSQSFDTAIFRVAANVLGMGPGTLTAPTISGFGLMLSNVTTAPSTNPVGGGIIYCEAGALKYRGTGGTVTTLGAA